jgi:hypothetical protein
VSDSSFVRELFRGIKVETVKCCRCKEEIKYQFESFMDISVSSSDFNTNNRSLQSLIYQSFGKCEFEETKKPLCQKCNKPNYKYERFTEIVEMPRYLIILLHRFEERLSSN